MNKIQPTFLSYVLCLFLCIQVYAQEERSINTDFQKERASLFSKLEVARVPYGILLDYGFDFTSMEFYEGGRELQEHVFATREDVKAVYKTMLSSTIGKLPAEFVHPDSLFRQWDVLRSAQQIVLSGSFTRYSRFVDELVAPKSIEIKDGFIVDKYVKGIWQNPYVQSQSFVLAPPISSYKGKKLTVIVPRELFITNETGSVHLAIDFNDGRNFQNVDWDTAISINYGTAGDKIWRYRLTTPSGVYYAQSKMKIIDWLRPVPTLPSSGQYCFPNSVVSVPIEASRSYLGEYATVDVTVACSGDGVIRKPLIVVEGFDVGNLMDPENEFGTTDYNTFINSIEYLNDSNLADLLLNDSREYDIFYINWRNGVDYMQRNAYAVQEVIRWVNSIKVGNEPNVVLGQSMGGVIGRYALADMEERNMDHDTRLFVSHDAPHLGANVPLSVQYMYRDLTQQYLEIENRGLGVLILNLFLDSEGRQRATEITRLLDQPAAKQLIKNWVNSNYQIDNSTHLSFYNELKNKGVNRDGYPIKSRNIALSNGSQCGNPQENIEPGDLLLDFNFDLRPGILLNVLADIVNPIAFLLGAEATGNTNFVEAAFLSTLPGSSRYIAEIKARANYDRLTQNIYYSTLKYKKKILWFFPAQKTISSRSQRQPSGILPIEHYGGGYFQVYDDNQASDFQGDQYYDLAVKQSFNFIPTPSALDIGNYRQTELTSIDYIRDYTVMTSLPSSKKSPFHSFITDYDIYTHESLNSRHISFNSRNANWLAQELRSIQRDPSCSFMCNGSISNLIQGVTFFCDTTTFQAPTLEAENYQWSFIKGGDLVNLTNLEKGKIRLSIKDTDESGLIVLQLKMSWEECGDIVIQKEIWVGKPKIRVEVHNLGNRLEATVHPWSSDEGSFDVQRAQVQWEGRPTNVPGVGQASFSSHGFMASASGFGKYWGVNVKVTVSNSCGSTSQSFGMYGGGFVNADDEGANVFLGIRGTKNSNEYEVVAQLKDVDGNIDVFPLVPQDKVNFYVYNMSGKLMKKTEKSILAINEFPVGTYILKAVVNDQYNAELKVYKK